MNVHKRIVLVIMLCAGYVASGHAAGKSRVEKREAEKRGRSATPLSAKVEQTKDRLQVVKNRVAQREAEKRTGSPAPTSSEAEASKTPAVVAMEGFLDLELYLLQQQKLQEKEALDRAEKQRLKKEEDAFNNAWKQHEQSVSLPPIAGKRGPKELEQSLQDKALAINAVYRMYRHGWVAPKITPNSITIGLSKAEITRKARGDKNFARALHVHAHEDPRFIGDFYGEEETEHEYQSVTMRGLGIWVGKKPGRSRL